MAAHVWRILCKTSINTRPLWGCTGKRTLLSEAYKCNEAWNQRLSSPVLQKVNIDDFCMKLHDKFEKEGRVNAIDLDIMINKLENLKAMDITFVENILAKFRQTQDAIKVLDSTHHALVRAYMLMGYTDRLVSLISDKLKYGIFPDVYSANILMDFFIKSKKFADAAKIGCDLMLQEMLAHPITNVLTIYACRMTLKNIAETVEAVDSTENKEDDEEIEYIPIKYVVNPWYDDHFDIIENRKILGKTLAKGACQQQKDICRSMELMGWGFYQKFDQGLQLIAKCQESKECSGIQQEALESFKTSLELAETKTEDISREHGMLTLDDERFNARITEEIKAQYQTQFQELHQQLVSSNKILSDNMDEELIKFVKSEVTIHESKDIDSQKDLFQIWVKQRGEDLDRQIKRYLVHQKKIIIEQKLKELQEKEELLNYFENLDEIEVSQLKAPPVVEAATADSDEDEEIVNKKLEKKR